MKTRHFFISTILACAPLVGNAQLQITEFMQSNIDLIYDQNEFPDSWVEIKNTGDTNFRLFKYRIGTSPNFEEAAIINGSNIARAGQYTLVYCDKDLSSNNAPIRLDSGKAGVYLFSPEGEILHHVMHLKQPAPNVAYGIDENGNWGYQLTPTPGEANKGGITNVILPEPTFSIESSVSYNTYRVVRAIITMPDGVPDDTKLCITTDGREPTIANAVSNNNYNQRFNTSTVIRAKLISSKAISPRSTCRSIIIHPRQSKLPTISIITDNKYLYDNSTGIFVNNNFYNDWRRPAYIEYFESSENTTSISQLGELRVHGGYTRVMAQKSMAVYSNKRFGTKGFSHPFWEDKPNVTKSKSFVLRNGGNNFTSSRINDAFCQVLFGNHADNLDWQAYKPVVCYINGQYHGIYGLRERSNEDIIEANYNGLEDIDMIENWEELKSGTIDSFNSLVALYNSKPTYQQMCEAIDVDNFVQTLIAQTWAANTDFPGNNMVMWRPSAQGGKWRWVLKDMDFFSYNSTSKVYFSTILRTHNHENDTDAGNRPEVVKIYQVMCSFPEFVDILTDKFAVYLGDFLRPSITQELLEDMRSELEPEYEEHLKRFDYPTSYDSWHDGISNLINWSKERTKKMPQIIATYFNLGAPVPVTINPNGCKVTFNDTPLTQPDFVGSYFSGKTVRLNVDADAQWKITINYPNGSSRVRNIANNECQLTLDSGYSSVNFEVVNITGIDDITADSKQNSPKIVAYNGEILIESTSQLKSVDVYRADGSLIFTEQSPQPTTYVPADKGIYIVVATADSGEKFSQKVAL